MNALKSLTFVAAPPKTAHSPTAIRRERLVQRLQEQLQLLKDPSYAPVVTRWKNAEDGVKCPVETIQLRPKLKRPSKDALPRDELSTVPTNDPAFTKQIMGFREWCEKVYDRREVLLDEMPPPVT